MAKPDKKPAYPAEILELYKTNLQKILDVLPAAKARFEAPAARAVGAFARDNSERPVPPYDSNACQWCVIGAVEAELKGEIIPVSPKNLAKLDEEVGKRCKGVIVPPGTWTVVWRAAPTTDAIADTQKASVVGFGMIKNAVEDAIKQLGSGSVPQ